MHADNLREIACEFRAQADRTPSNASRVESLRIATVLEAAADRIELSARQMAFLAEKLREATTEIQDAPEDAP